MSQVKDPALDPDLDPKSLQPEDWQQILSPTEFAILRNAATEPAGSGRYLDAETSGYYCCAGCGQKLYGSGHKFHSGCGWPSFFQEVEEGALTRHEDRSFGRTRLEMRCSRCDGHLGHIFEDAPNQPTGQRHCVNGEALVFVPDDATKDEVFLKHRKTPS